MSALPSLYRAKAVKVTGRQLQAFVPQVFGDTPITIDSFLGDLPAVAGMGWVFFQGGDAAFPVWSSGTFEGGNGGLEGPPGPVGPQGPPGVVVVQHGYDWSTNNTASDPGAGFIKRNAASTALYVSIYNQAGTAVVSLVELLTGDRITIYESNAVNQRVQYVLTGPVVNNSNQWLTIPVSVVVNLGFAPSNNNDVELYLPVKVPDEVWIGPDQPTDTTTELWVRNTDITLWAKTSGNTWTQVTSGGGSGGGVDEVWIGPGTPPATQELWFDTDDSPTDPAIDAANFWNSAWGYIGQSTSSNADINLSAETTICTLSVNLVAGRRYKFTALTTNTYIAGGAVAGDTYGMFAYVDGTTGITSWYYSTDYAGNYVSPGNQIGWFSATTGAHTVTLKANRVSGTGLMKARYQFTVEDWGPVTPASVNPPAGQPTISVAGNALGVVAVGAEVAGGLTNAAAPLSAAGMPTTIPVTFTFQVGRRYRITARFPATYISTGPACGLEFQILDAANAMVGDGSTWIWATTAGYAGGLIDTRLDGDGTTKTVRAVVKTVNAANGTTAQVYVDPLYIEDLGPNSTPALPIPETAPGWTPLTISSPWTAFSTASYGVPGYRRIGDIVELRGQVSGTAVGKTNPITSLPVGFRPGVNYMSVAWGSVGAAPEQAYRMDITTSGAVLWNVSGTNTVNYLSLNDIRFSVTP